MTMYESGEKKSDMCWPNAWVGECIWMMEKTRRTYKLTTFQNIRIEICTGQIRIFWFVNGWRTDETDKQTDHIPKHTNPVKDRPNSYFLVCYGWRTDETKIRTDNIRKHTKLVKNRPNSYFSVCYGWRTDEKDIRMDHVAKHTNSVPDQLNSYFFVLLRMMDERDRHTKRPDSKHTNLETDRPDSYFCISNGWILKQQFIRNNKFMFLRMENMQYDVKNDISNSPIFQRFLEGIVKRMQCRISHDGGRILHHGIIVHRLWWVVCLWSSHRSATTHPLNVFTQVGFGRFGGPSYAHHGQMDSGRTKETAIANKSRRQQKLWDKQLPAPHS